MTSNAAFILSLASAETIKYDDTETSLGTDNVQGAIVEINGKIERLPSPMVFKGSLGIGGTIEQLPLASTENEGHTYKVITDGTYAGIFAESGDVFTSDGTNWILFTSGDDPAMLIDYDNTSSGLESTNVQSAIDEVVETVNTKVSESDLAAVAISGSYNDLQNAPNLSAVATSGSYNDLANKPALKTVATSGSYNDLSDKPALKTVATSGSYNDLTNKPTIPSVDSSLSSSSTNPVQNKVIKNALDAKQDSSTLSAVATSGSYNDLTNKPALKTVATSGSYNDLSDKPALAAVATSGSYNDLSDKPTIGNATLTIQKNGTSAGTFKANATSNKSINIEVPDYDLSFTKVTITKTGSTIKIAAWSLADIVCTSFNPTLGQFQTIVGILGYSLPAGLQITNLYWNSDGNPVITVSNRSDAQISVASGSVTITAMALSFGQVI